MSFFMVSQKKNSVELGSDDKNDIDKIKNVIQKTGLSNMAGIDNIRIKRLGETQGDQDKPRAIILKSSYRPYKDTYWRQTI